MERAITPQMFGALGDNSTNDFTAFQAALTQALKVGRDLYVPTGTYVLSSSVPLVADLSLLPSSYGIKIYGDGAGSFLSFPISPPATTDSLFKVYASGGGQYFSFGMRDLRIEGTIADPGAVLMLGDTGFATEINASHFTGLTIRNPGSTGNLGPALLLNFVIQCTIEGAFNSSATNGMAGLRLQKASYNRISASVGAAGYTTDPHGTNYYGIGIHITSGNMNASNVFLSADCESTWTGIQIDSAQAQGNVFVAPYFATNPSPSIMQYGLYVTPSAGGSASYNRFIQPFFNGTGFVQTIRTTTNPYYVVEQT